MGLKHGLSMIAAASSLGAIHGFTDTLVKTGAFQRQSTELFERKPFITGNWKLNPQSKSEAKTLATEIASQVKKDSPCDVALFVPYPFLETVQSAVSSRLTVGAEAIFPELSGAFTGGVSAPMLQSIGVNWSLAGHSERRSIFGESDEDINKQCRTLIAQGMSVMLCIGETLSEFERNLVGPVCEIQLKKALAGVSKSDMSRVAIAYEPVWAIGTGKVATPEIAQDVHATCRKVLAEMYGSAIAEEVRILYGGSVTPESIDGLLDKPDIDGALVGGASLDAEKFGRIINFVPVKEAALV